MVREDYYTGEQFSSPGFSDSTNMSNMETGGFSYTPDLTSEDMAWINQQYGGQPIQQPIQQPQQQMYQQPAYNGYMQQPQQMYQQPVYNSYVPQQQMYQQPAYNGYMQQPQQMYQQPVYNNTNYVPQQPQMQQAQMMYQQLMNENENNDQPQTQEEEKPPVQYVYNYDYVPKEPDISIDQLTFTDRYTPKPEDQKTVEPINTVKKSTDDQPKEEEYNQDSYYAKTVPADWHWDDSQIQKEALERYERQKKEEEEAKSKSDNEQPKVIPLEIPIEQQQQYYEPIQQPQQQMYQQPVYNTGYMPQQQFQFQPQYTYYNPNSYYAQTLPNTYPWQAYASPVIGNPQVTNEMVDQRRNDWIKQQEATYNPQTPFSQTLPLQCYDPHNYADPTKYSSPEERERLQQIEYANNIAMLKTYQQQQEMKAQQEMASNFNHHEPTMPPTDPVEKQKWVDEMMSHTVYGDDEILDKLDRNEEVTAEDLAKLRYNITEKSPQEVMQQQQQQAMHSNSQPQQQMYQQPMMGQPSYNYGYMPQYGQQPLHGINGFPPPYVPGSYGYNAGYGSNQLITPAQIASQYTDQVINVKGYSIGGEALYPEDVQKKMDKLKADMFMEVEKSKALHDSRVQGIFVNNPAAVGYYGYGGGYNNDYIEQSIIDKYQRKIDDIKKQAQDTRSSFNKRLSKLCHNYVGDNKSDEDINRIYDGYSYTIPAQDHEEYEKELFMASCVPFDNSGMYQKRDKEISDWYKSIVDPAGDMQSFLRDQGKFKNALDLEAEDHRRRNDGELYNSDTYRMLLRDAIRNRDSNGKVCPTYGEAHYGIPSGVALNTSFVDPRTIGRPDIGVGNPPIKPEPTDDEAMMYEKDGKSDDDWSVMGQCGRVMEDGMVHITTPPWIGNGGVPPTQEEMSEYERFMSQGKSVVEGLEDKYNDARDAFLTSIYHPERVKPRTNIMERLAEQKKKERESGGNQ